MGDPDHASPPQISVIVAVHDVAPYIGEAIASLLAQSHRDFEALIIDDGSQDGSGEIAAAAFGADPRFTLIRQENRGLSGARNSGLARARGAWIAFLDGDDAFEPGALAALLAAAREAGTDWAAGAILLCYPDGSRQPHSGRHDHPAPAAGPETLSLDDAGAVAPLFPSAWNKLYRRHLFEGLRYPEGLWFEDHEPFWQLARKAPRLALLPEPVLRHRRDRPGQITGSDSERAFEIFTVLARLRPLIEAWPGGRAALATHASRLLSERLEVLADPPRRARFLAAAQDWLAGAGLGYSAGAAPEIQRGPGLAMAGEPPLAVILLTTGRRPAALAKSRASLEAGLLPEHQRLEAGPGALAETLARCSARHVILLPEGETLLPGAGRRLSEAALRRGAVMALGALELEGMRGIYYDAGWHSPEAQPAPPEQLDPFGEALSLTPARAAALRLSAARMALGRGFLLDLLREGDDPADPLLPARLMLRALEAQPAPVALIGYPVARVPARRFPASPQHLAPLLAEAGPLRPHLARRLLETWLASPVLPPKRALRFGLALRRAGLRIAPGDPLAPRLPWLLRRLLA